MRLKLFRNNNNLDKKLIKNKNFLSLKFFIYFFSIIFITTCSINILINKDKIINELSFLTTKLGFKLEIIEIIGRNHTNQNEIIQIVQKEKTPLINLDLVQIRSDIINIGWIEDAIVLRKLPKKIVIRIKEHIPIALLQTKQGHQLINKHGKIINEKNISNFSHLPVVSGKNASSRAFHILNVLKTEPEIFSDVWAIQFISERRWDIYLKSGITIKLPEKEPVFAWTKFAKLERENSITKRDLAVIDLRNPSQLIVEPNLPIRGKGSET